MSSRWLSNIYVGFLLTMLLTVIPASGAVAQDGGRTYLPYSSYRHTPSNADQAPTNVQEFSDGVALAGVPPVNVPVWRVLFLVYPRIDTDYTDSNGVQKHLTYTMAAQEILDGERSFRQAVALANELSNGQAAIAPKIVHVTRSLTSLTSMGTNLYWPSPNDTRTELDQLAPTGSYDSVMLLWPQTNLQTGEQIPSGGWGLAIGPTGWSNGATYASVSSVRTDLWNMPTVGEVWLHEWLHGVASYYAGQGYRMPDRDADGGSSHGYVWSPQTGWSNYYRDLMTGRVLDNGSLTGITPDAWQSGSIGGPRSDIIADYFNLDTVSGYTIMGKAAWQNTPAQDQHVLLGGGEMADHRISRPYMPEGSFILTGRVQIPASGVGYYDSVALAITNGGSQYWAALLYGPYLGNERNVIEIMRNDRHRTLVPMNLSPGWYTVRLLADKRYNVLRLKVWRDGASEPSAWQVSEPLEEGWKPTAIGFRHYGQGARVDDLVATPWTSAPPVSDVIFADGFESGNLWRWSASSTDGGDLTAQTKAALAGEYGLGATVDDNSGLYVVDNTPADLNRYRARFYLDPNSTTMAVGNVHVIFRGNSRVRMVLRAELRRLSTGYGIRVSALQDDLTWKYLNSRVISDVPTAIEIDWRAATSAGLNDGWLVLWINGVRKGTISPLDNDQQRVTTVWLGPHSTIDAGTRGAYFIDAFESRSRTYIGRNTSSSLALPVGHGGEYASELSQAIKDDATVEAIEETMAPAATAKLQAGSEPLILESEAGQVTVSRPQGSGLDAAQFTVSRSDEFASPDGFLPIADAIAVDTESSAPYEVRVRRPQGRAWSQAVAFRLNATGDDWSPANVTTEDGDSTLVIAAKGAAVLLISEPVAGMDAGATNSLYLPGVLR